MGSITAETANRPIANKARLIWTAFRPRRSAPTELNRRIDPLAFAIFATGTDAGVVAGMLPQIAQDFHLGIGVVSQLLTAYAITYAVGSPFFGVVASQYRSERLILVCLLAFASAVALSAVSPGLAVLLVARMLAASVFRNLLACRLRTGRGTFPAGPPRRRPEHGRQRLCRDAGDQRSHRNMGGRSSRMARDVQYRHDAGRPRGSRTLVCRPAPNDQAAVDQPRRPPRAPDPLQKPWAR